MRNDAFREADLIIILGTRTNYVIGHSLPPRFSATAKIARIDIDIDPEEIDNSPTMLCSLAHTIRLNLDAKMASRSAGFMLDARRVPVRVGLPAT